MSLSNDVAARLRESIVSLDRSCNNLTQVLIGLNAALDGIDKRVSGAVAEGMLEALTNPNVVLTAKLPSGTAVVAPAPREPFMLVPPPSPAPAAPLRVPDAEQWPRLVMPASCASMLAAPVPMPKVAFNVPKPDKLGRQQRPRGLTRHILHAIVCLKPERRTLKDVHQVVNAIFSEDKETYPMEDVREMILHARRMRWIKGELSGPYLLTDGDSGGREFIHQTINRLYTRDSS